jgi:hypothetical protein
MTKENPTKLRMLNGRLCGIEIPLLDAKKNADMPFGDKIASQCCKMLFV